MWDFLLMDYFLEQFMWDFVSTFQHMILEEKFVERTQTDGHERSCLLLN